MNELYTTLNESDDLSSAVGDVFFHQDSNFYVVPFIHYGVEFLAYFNAVETSSMSLDVFKTAIESNTTHKVSDKPYIFKFGLKNNFQSDDMFGVNSQHKIGKLHFTMPKKLGLCIRKLVEKTNATEFYFLAGSNDEKHQGKLDVWYDRITKRFAPQYNFAPIHQDTQGGWYGFKTDY